MASQWCNDDAQYTNLGSRMQYTKRQSRKEGERREGRGDFALNAIREKRSALPNPDGKLPHRDTSSKSDQRPQYNQCGNSKSNDVRDHPENLHKTANTHEKPANEPNAREVLKKPIMPPLDWTLY
ncbi:Hypothetical predicted protein [Mytilus galloprovincialis]|uniref:Uncharacterized protein n=1 Tax=Mytilus galloprovincialis TaxID=29158 RepID=A0A8B6BRD3_MYTGA|nr:Hypothetical predicted protein [Mytilus galloprovincialis]